MSINSHQFRKDGHPEGGQTFGTGFAIAWQRGPLGAGETCKPNGAFVEDIIAAAIDRLEFFQDSAFKCIENEEALAHLGLALKALDDRTKRRVAAGTEGTYIPN